MLYRKTDKKPSKNGDIFRKTIFGKIDSNFFFCYLKWNNLRNIIFTKFLYRNI